MALNAATIEAADAKLQALIKSRGGDGVIGLARNFRIIDVDKSGHLSKAEFARAMELFRAGLTAQEVEALFQKYDSDKSGTISVDEYLRGIRGTISKTRKALVNRVFANMDTDGSGELTVEDLRKKYDATRNPDVTSGKKTVDQVLGEFLHTFEGEGGQRGDGIVTRQEWLDYYTGVSSNIDSDDYFLLLICNVWGFPYSPLSKVQNLIKMMQTKVKTLQKGYESEEKTLIKQFRAIDTDGSGEVDVAEFKQCFANMGLIMPPGSNPEETKMVELLFVLFDVDASGALSYAEFAHASLHYEF